MGDSASELCNAFSVNASNRECSQQNTWVLKLKFKPVFLILPLLEELFLKKLRLELQLQALRMG